MTFPAAPSQGQIFYDPDTKEAWRYNSVTLAWDPVRLEQLVSFDRLLDVLTDENIAIDGYVPIWNDAAKRWIPGPGGGGGGGLTIYVQTTTPIEPPVDSLWWNDSTGTLSVYYYDGNSTQWVQISGPSSGAMVKLAEGSVSSPVLELPVALPGIYTSYKLVAENLVLDSYVGISNGIFGAQFSFDGGVTWLGDGVNNDSYIYGKITFDVLMGLGYYATYDSSYPASFEISIFPGSATVLPWISSNSNTSLSGGVSGGAGGFAVNSAATIPPPASRVTDIKLFPGVNVWSASTINLISGSWTLYGIV